MVASLYHPQQRIFPTISTNIYNSNPTNLTPDQQTAYNILALAKQKNKLGYLLTQHQQAIEAELASKWQRADFFFRQVYIEIKALFKQPQELAQLADNLDAAQFCQRMLRELFIDTHCAFYNGLISKTQKLTWNARAFAHIDYIQQLLELSVFSNEEVLSLLAAGWHKRIDACKEAKKWRQCINYCQQRLKLLPYNIDFQGELAEVIYLATVEKCPQVQSQWQYSQNSKTLQRGIKQLEKHRKQYPHSLVTFQVLSGLYHLHAVSLSHINQLAKSLVSIQKAITYNPYSTRAYQTRNELVETMTQLQQQMNEQVADIRRRGMQLTHKGLKLLDQVNIGFAPMNKYIDSEEAKQISISYHIAEAIYLWRRIGLSEPHDRWAKTQDSKSSSIQTALQLNEALTSILQHSPQKAEIATAWQAIVENKPNLAQLDAVRICNYLEECLFQDEHRVLVTPPAQDTVSPPILTPISKQPQMSTEPFIPWLLSPQDKRIKLQALVASVLIAATGYIAIRETTIVAKRENSYKTILVAQQVQNDKVVLNASKEFFQNQSLISKDERIPQIAEIYQESLVRWFAQQPKAEITKENQEYIDLYKKLEKNITTAQN
jgi:hypothetical protein